MLTDRPLLETPLRDWTYEALHQFLDARIREDERIEYKEKFSDATFTDTLVSMANGVGGYIFVGVSVGPTCRWATVVSPTGLSRRIVGRVIARMDSTCLRLIDVGVPHTRYTASRARRDARLE